MDISKPVNRARHWCEHLAVGVCTVQSLALLFVVAVACADWPRHGLRRSWASSSSWPAERRSHPVVGKEEEEQSPAIYKQESWRGVWSQVRVWALIFFIYRYSCSQLAYLWAKKMPELLNYLLSVLFGCHSIAWGRGATMAFWRKNWPNIHPELSVLLAPKK